jgi:beta-1,4-N-acetylglucosaminyltransferase
MLNVFVTVGSWQFDKLVEHVDQTLDSDDLKVVIQYGNGDYEPAHHESFRLAPSIQPYIAAADLVISHGGTGSVLEILGQRKPLIAVPNLDVQDNHQKEFLDFLSKRGIVAGVERPSEITRELILSVFEAGARESSLGSLYSEVVSALDDFISEDQS